MMRLAVAMLIASTVGASAYGGQPPPANYDRPYKGKLTIHRLDPLQVRKVCGAQAVACARVGKRRCTIYMSGLDNWKTRLTLKHELAHCKGWMH
jgi:hypothetical protein